MNKGTGIFITGTDTDIGKTYAARLVADTLAEGRTVTYMKPVQTGCVRDPQGALMAPDFDFVMKGGAIMTAEPGDHVPYRFEPACSPHLAASREGVAISLDYIRERYARVSTKESIAIVEGAGGLLTPLNDTDSMLDLIVFLKLPVVIVTSPRVGTLNHTLLTVRALELRGISPVGIVVNSHQQTPRDFIYFDNCRMIRRMVPEAAFLELEFGAEIDDAVREFCGKILERK
jgi:dethiobiotin synthetase